MASQNNANCNICGKAYYLCMSCKDMMALHPYKVHTDTPEHYKIYQVIHGYNTGVYNIAEAKAKLQTIDMSDKNIYLSEIKEVINKIMAYEDKSVKVEKPVENNTTKVKSISKKTKKNTDKNVKTENGR